MKRIIEATIKLKHLSRADDWKASFVPFVMGFVYLWLFVFQIAPSKKIGLVCFFSLLTTVGFASFGYFINEYFDQEEDKKAGKLNRFQNSSPALILLILLVSLLLTFLPWLFLPSNKWSWVLIALELGSFLAYSIPPFRLKRYPLLSCVLDTSYAYVVPLVLSMHTFSLQADKSLFTTFLFSLTLPIFFIGFRNILLHQIHDVIGDYHAKRRTLPMILGKNELFNLLSISLFIEVISFCILYEWFFPEIHLGIIYLVYFSLKFFIFSKKETIKSSKNEFDFFRLTDRFYQIWFPVFVLFILTMKSTDWQFLWFFQLFILLLNFKSHVINGKIISVLNSLKIGLSYFVNYSIFIAFLIFGVNLKKEQMSAWQYLTRKSN